MKLIEGTYRQVIEKSEWVAIVTCGPDGLHTAACWVRNVLRLGIDHGEIRIPVWRLKKTAANIAAGSRVELLFVASEVECGAEKGQGLSVRGTGEVQSEGEFAEMVRVLMPWAKAVLVVAVEDKRLHLPDK